MVINISVQYSGGLLPDIMLLTQGYYCLKKNLNAPRPSEHPPVRGKKSQNV